MSIKLTNHLEGNYYQHKEFVLEQLANATGIPNVQGVLYTNTSDKGFYYYDGTAWKRIDNQSMTASAILTALLTVHGAGSGLDADLLDGQQGSHYLNRANHSGSQTASTISDLATTVKSYRLDEFANPTSNIDLNNRKITNLANPTSATSNDAAPASWVTNAINNAVQGLDIKDSVKAISVPNPANTATGRYNVTYSETGNGFLTIPGNSAEIQAIFDGVTLNIGDRVIFSYANSSKDNGFYKLAEINASDSVFERVDLIQGQLIGNKANSFAFVERGVLYKDTGWVLAQPDSYVAGVGSDHIQFIQFSSAGVITAKENGGIVKEGNEISIDKTIVAQKYSTSIGNTTGNTNVSFTITHNLNTEDVYVSVREASGAKEFVLADTAVTGVNTVTVTFADPPTANQYRVTVIG